MLRVDVTYVIYVHNTTAPHQFQSSDVVFRLIKNNRTEFLVPPDRSRERGRRNATVSLSHIEHLNVAYCTVITVFRSAISSRRAMRLFINYNTLQLLRAIWQIAIPRERSTRRSYAPIIRSIVRSSINAIFPEVVSVLTATRGN